MYGSEFLDKLKEYLASRGEQVQGDTVIERSSTFSLAESISIVLDAILLAFFVSGILTNPNIWRRQRCAFITSG